MWKEGRELKLRVSWNALYVFLIAFVFTAIFVYRNGGDLQETQILAEKIMIIIFCLYIILNPIYCYLFTSSVVIGKDGVKIGRSKEFKWEDIRYVFLTQRSTGRRARTYLVVELQNSEEEIVDVSCRKHNESEIEAAVSYWSGREIGSFQHKCIDEKAAEGKLTEEEYSSICAKRKQYVPLFRSFSRNETYWGVALMVLYVAAVFYKNAEIGSDGNWKSSINLLEIVFGALLTAIILYLRRKIFFASKKVSALPPKESKLFFDMVGSFFEFWKVVAVLFALTAVVFAIWQIKGW